MQARRCWKAILENSIVYYIAILCILIYIFTKESLLNSNALKMKAAMVVFSVPLIFLYVF